MFVFKKGNRLILYTYHHKIKEFAPKGFQLPCHEKKTTTPPESNKLHLKMDGWNSTFHTFLLGRLIVRGENVGFRKGNDLEIHGMELLNATRVTL